MHDKDTEHVAFNHERFYKGIYLIGRLTERKYTQKKITKLKNNTRKEN